jgi:hypothetical protein
MLMSNQGLARRRVMQWQFLTVLVLALPIIILPVALVWYVNVGLVWHTIGRIGRRHVVQKDELEKTGTLILADSCSDRHESPASIGWEYIDIYLLSSLSQSTPEEKK